jgi:hypothetical protein
VPRTPALRWLAGAFLAVNLLACAAMPAPSAGSRTATVATGRGQRSQGERSEDASVINQAELQQALQRVASQFQSRVAQVNMDAKKGERGEQQDLVMRQSLFYQSSVLDIATGAEPEVNLLDMAVFARLSAGTLKSYWTSERLGDASRALSDAFVSLESDLQPLLARVLSSEQRALLERLIDGWQAENPDQHVVEGVRFVGFGQVAGAAADARINEVRGLLSSVKTATQAADRALLLAERALFLSQRVPFLLRAQARLGAREIAGDALVLLDDMDSLLQHANELRPMISETSTLLVRVADVTERARAMSRELEPLLQRASALLNDEQLEKTLATADRLSARTLSLLTQLERMQAANEGALAQVTTEVDALVRRWIVYLALAGAACVLLFWVGYYVVKRRG